MLWTTSPKRVSSTKTLLQGTYYWMKSTLLKWVTSIYHVYTMSAVSIWHIIYSISKGSKYYILYTWIVCFVCNELRIYCRIGSSFVCVHACTPYGTETVGTYIAQFTFERDNEGVMFSYWQDTWETCKSILYTLFIFSVDGAPYPNCYVYTPRLNPILYTTHLCIIIYNKLQLLVLVHAGTRS